MAQQSIDDFLQDLQGLGEQITNLESDLLEIGLRIVNQMKTQAPVNTGSLRNSIQALVTSNSLEIQMLAYGLFQNYGVKGTRSGFAFGVPREISPQPRTGNQYSFNPENSMIGGNLPFGARVKIHQYGLKPQQFFDLDAIADQIEQELGNRIQI